MTDDHRTSTPIPPSPHRPGRNRRWLLGTAGGGVLAAVVVAASLAGGATGVDLSLTGGAGPRSGAGTAASGDPITFSFTGSAQSITVPDGTTTARVQIAGAQGGVAYGTIFGKPATGGGQGYVMMVDLPVRAGEVFTIGVGGQGATANRNQGPGGGWSLDDSNGGNGGHSKGHEDDGAGGGGASVIKIDGTTVLITGAGGGQVNDGSALHGSGGAGGGTDVMDFGGTGGAADGPADRGGRGGRGGADYLGPMNKTGQDAAGTNHGAGAGGGGGLHNGEGGKNWTGRPAGGGGTSYINLSRKGTILSSGACCSGHRSIVITWNPTS